MGKLFKRVSSKGSKRNILSLFLKTPIYLGVFDTK